VIDLYVLIVFFLLSHIINGITTASSDDWTNSKINSITTEPMLVLSPTLNTFQVSRSGNEDFEVGTVSATCTRPWLFGKAPQKSLWESKDKNVFEGKEMRKDLCNRVGDLYSQKISADGHKRYLGSEYMDFRSIAIEQFDAVSLLPMVVVDPLVVCDRFVLY